MRVCAAMVSATRDDKEPCRQLGEHLVVWPCRAAGLRLRTWLCDEHWMAFAAAAETAQ